ncbi:TonB-linked outer membrane protein, SusC/RagA family [Alistipes timonensis JC136]|uniref:TonB-linked outer membrane protein, SusC/RagA family n=1 Tax=Alistipes timonensis JC136 TaxID=1033731 RepID=A0A1H4E4A9_9BACT|nr:TonB-dependent receptor [Alistipes timonensis]SEA79746.1 TonB-linked outer membrane protein, SusC/RagA family [Alistipes timonensis JC136]
MKNFDFLFVSKLKRPAATVLATLAALLLTTSLQAQQRLTVSGVVTDAASGEPIIGASVIVASTYKGTTTGVNGDFMLTNIPAKDSLIFQHLNYTRLVVPVNGRTKIDAKLSVSAVEIEEVVAVGYGYVPRSNLTSSIAVISEKDINKTPVSSIEQALQGNATGVLVITASGEPGSEVAMRIRGGTSISGDTSPLVVIDNIPSDQTALSLLNPNDVAGIEILKDAAATAIYGSRGANGVVMVTTRSGQAGKPTLSVNAEYGLSIPRYRIEMMNSEQYAEYDNFARMMWGVNSFNTLRPDTLTTNDYQKRLLRDIAQRHNYTVALQGGSKDMRYYISGGWLSEEGILRNSSNERLSFSTKFNMNLSPRLHLDIKASLSRQQTEKISSGDSGATLRMLMQKPTSTINGTDLGDGTYIDEETGEIKSINTEAAKALNSNQWNKRTTAELNAVFRWDIDKRKYWTFNSTAGYKYNNSNDYAYVLRSIYSTEAHIDKNNKATRKTSQGITWSNENFINFSRTFSKKHFLMWTLGQSWQRQESEGFNIDVTRFDTDYFMWNNLGAGAYIGVPGSSYKAINHLSFFTRAIYTYNERFTATFSLRADGSSRFGEDSRYGYFPAASVSWKMTKEKWLKNVKWISELKPRFSVGVTGNDRIGEYKSPTMLSSNKVLVNGQSYNGTTISQIGNPNLQWETTHEYNGGLDVGLFKNRIRFSVDAYYKKTYNLLYNYRLPQTTGYSQVSANVGNIDNKGVEFEIHTRNIEHRNFSWNTDFNIGWNKSTITDLGGNDHVVLYHMGNGVNQDITFLEIGQPLGIIKGYETSIYKNWDEVYADDAVWVEDPLNIQTRPGMIKYIDQNGDGVINDQDKVVLGQALPNVMGGFTNTFNYKNWSLTVFFNYALGGKIINTNVTKLDLYQAGNNNAYADGLGAWRPANPITGDQGWMGGSKPLPSSNSSPSTARLYTQNVIDRWIEDGSYLRLKTLSLTYTVPEKISRKIGMQRLMLSLKGTNLWTWTKYRGFDPEMSSSVGTSNSTLGIDRSSYPASKSFTFNVNITF